MNTSAIIALGAGTVFLGIMLWVADLGTVRLVNPDRREISPAGPAPDDFVLTYSYGVGLDYTLRVDETGNASFDVGMCRAALPLHATILMSMEEVEMMWKYIEENRLFDLTEDFTKGCPAFGECITIAPVNRIVLAVQANGETKTIEFNQNYALNHSNEQLDRFREVTNTIDDVLEGYEGLPKSDCLYA